MLGRGIFIKILALGVLAWLAFSYYAPEPVIESKKEPLELKSAAETPEAKSATEPEPFENGFQKIEEMFKEPAPASAEIKTETKQESSPAGLSVVSVDSLEEKPVNSKSIAAVQCLWDYTYPENVYEDSRFHEPFYSQGSGVVVSGDGLILTANHVVENKIIREPDPAGKKWFLKKCEAALTDEPASPLRYDSPRFKEAEIVFQPTAEEYDYKSENRADFDVALLKFKETGEYPFTPIFGSLVDSDLKEESVFLKGYPAAELTGQREMETLEFFSALQKYKGRGVGETALFYQAGSKKFSAASESYKQFQKALFESGRDDRLVKGGFSGSPVFVKGNLVGVVLASSLPFVEQEDKAVILSSYSIAELLKKHNF